MATAAAKKYREARDLLLDLRDDHAAALERFSWPQIDGPFNWAHDWFDAIADGNDRPALRVFSEDGTETSRTFAEMARRSNQVARLLSRRGVGVGDVVMIMLGNRVELWESMLAVMKIGAVILPATTALGATDLTDRIERSGARHVIADVTVTDRFADVPGTYGRTCVGGTAPGWEPYAEADEMPDTPLPHPGTQCDDPLLRYFTSGTTSRPKLVQHTQVSYPVGSLSTMYWIGLRPGDVHLNISAPGWAKHAWSSFFAPWIAEATIVALGYTRFDPATLPDWLRAAGVTSCCAPPTVWRMLINAELGERPERLRSLVSAGEPLNPEVIKQVQDAWGLTIRDGFGQTETTALIGNTPGSRVKPGSMGRPLPGVPIVLLDPVTGQPAQHEGEICVDLSAQPVNVMTGYLGDPERDAEAKAGGYYHTGDVATRDDEGYITYVGRTDDVFKSSDYKVSPFELESVLITHPAVAEAAVVPAPDPIRLAVPKAYIALAPGWEPTRETALAILRHARENLAPYLRIRRVEFAELPKTISGKIRRAELRARENQAGDSTSRREWRDDEFPELRGRTEQAPSS